MKTRREHLSVLPAEILEEIHEEIKEKSLIEDEVMLHRCGKGEAFKNMFTFAATRKGHDYWWAIYEKYIN